MLWSSDCLARRHPAFQKAYNMEDADKQALLGNYLVDIFCKQINCQSLS